MPESSLKHVQNFSKVSGRETDISIQRVYDLQRQSAQQDAYGWYHEDVEESRSSVMIRLKVIARRLLRR